jgi:hypothetical protein
MPTLDQLASGPGARSSSGDVTGAFRPRKTELREIGSIHFAGESRVVPEGAARPGLMLPDHSIVGTVVASTRARDRALELT